jgi:hypothetical protein
VIGSFRRRAIVAITAATILWPLAHLVLVARFGVDPWELFGWAMYSQPAPRVSVRVDVERGGEKGPLRAMGELRGQLRDWARRRSTLGRLASPDPLAGRIFASDPTIDAAVVVVRRLELDRKTGYLIDRDETLRIAREQPSSP